jgi:hypothetical protein
MVQVGAYLLAHMMKPDIPIVQPRRAAHVPEMVRRTAQWDVSGFGVDTLACEQECGVDFGPVGVERAVEGRDGMDVYGSCGVVLLAEHVLVDCEAEFCGEDGE